MKNINGIDRGINVVEDCINYIIFHIWNPYIEMIN